MLYNTPKDRYESISEWSTQYRKGWNVDWKISPTLATVLDKDHRTAFQITQDGDAIIAPSSSGYPQRVWRDLFEFNLANQVNFLKNIL